MADGGREVEIVPQGVLPALLDLRRGFGVDGDAPEADGELVQTFDGTVCRLEQLGRKGKRAAVVRPGQQRVADGAWRVPLGKQLANRRKVLETLGHLLARRSL